MSIDLKPHNVEAYDKVKENFTRSNRVAVIHPTGTGKSYLALKMLEENKRKSAVYIAPTNAILHNVKKTIFDSGMDMKDFPNLKRITYTKLANLSDQEIENLASEIIVLDEFHHCGAPEWGAGVDRLLDVSTDANILGLSATPIRYNDGYRDMAEELFDGNVASEMTLEEAIEREILPGATYVSALYSYTDELENMQEQIEQIHDEDNKNKAQRLFNELKGKLDDNTQNLPELLSSHMTNKSGKYIVFCKNIEDMRQKIEESKNIFNQVNTNITTYDVASDRTLEKNEDTLKSFENDNNQETLKLLFAVDMLNEGYHINDLDGVVMMRPTFSPTIFVQQLGRALSAGVDKDKAPVILDLVDNFDSCKIIEDFCERMKQYKNDNDIKENKSDEKSKLSIFDTTKEFREIANKINDLSKKKKISIEQKIEIFERFKETGEELTGKTVFEGYPIGEWGISIRATINSGNATYTAEIREKLDSLGVLERQIEATIDERIQFIVDWNNKYPKAKLAKGKTIPEEILREYSNSGEEYNELLKEYQKANRYFTYVIDRYYRGKLTEEQKQIVRNSNINKKFGYSDEINNLAEQYRINPEKITYIIDKYGDMESFKEAYKNGQLDENDEKVLKDNLRRTVSIDGIENKNLDKLQTYIMGDTSFTIYDSDSLMEILETLTPRLQELVKMRFGLVDGEIKTINEVASELNVTGERIRQIEAKALRNLKYRSRENKRILYDDLLKQAEVLNTNEVDANITNSIFDSNVIFYCDEEYSHIPANIDKSKIIDLILSEREKYNGKTGSNKTMLIENMGFSVGAYSKLKRSGINTIYELSKLTEDELIKNTLLRPKEVEEVLLKIEPFRSDEDLIKDLEYRISKIKSSTITIEDATDNGFENIENLTIEEMGFSVRTYNCLKRYGINTGKQLKSLPREKLLEIRNLGKSSLQEVENKLDGVSKEGKSKKIVEVNCLEDLGLPAQTYGALKKANINFSELLNMSNFDIEDIAGIGKIGARTIKRKIELIKTREKLPELESKLKQLKSSKRKDEITIESEEAINNGSQSKDSEEQKLDTQIFFDLTNKEYAKLEDLGFDTMHKLVNTSKDELNRLFARITPRAKEKILKGIQKVKEEQIIANHTTNVEEVEDLQIESRKDDSNSIVQSINEQPSKENNELEELRKHKMELQKQVMALESQVTAAKELLASYEKIIESKELNNGQVQE